MLFCGPLGWCSVQQLDLSKPRKQHRKFWKSLLVGEMWEPAEIHHTEIIEFTSTSACCSIIISNSVISRQNVVNRNFLPCKRWPERMSINNWQPYGDCGQFRSCPERGTNQSKERTRETCRKHEENELLHYKVREESLTAAWNLKCAFDRKALACENSMHNFCFMLFCLWKQQT